MTEYVYPKAGTYTIKVYCGNGNCTGEAQAVVKVRLKLQGTLGSGSLPVGANPCPPGWHKKSGETNGAFSCVPNKPTKIQCPPGTSYYENECVLGCQVVPN